MLNDPRYRPQPAPGSSAPILPASPSWSPSQPPDHPPPPTYPYAPPAEWPQGYIPQGLLPNFQPAIDKVVEVVGMIEAMLVPLQPFLNQIAANGLTLTIKTAGMDVSINLTGGKVPPVPGPVTPANDDNGTPPFPNS